MLVSTYILAMFLKMLGDEYFSYSCDDFLRNIWRNTPFSTQGLHPDICIN